MDRTEFLTRQQLADLLQVDLSTIWRWEQNGMPKVQLGERLIRYHLKQVLAWLKAQAGTAAK